jgi:two-component system sensor histidine kinase MtrB
MADALEAKIAALAEAEARERRFTSDVAHELRTPLTALVAEASLLRDHLARMPAEVRRPAELLIGDIGRLRTLVEELMEISRLDARSEAVRLEPVDLRTLVASVLRVHGWDNLVSFQGDELVICSDARRLERIVANLVGNAVEHGGPAVEVILGGDDAARATVEVSDSGPGVAPEHLTHIFERFYKVDRARVGTGSGLGLAIALENARLLGGDITVESGSGVPPRTRFRLIVPRQPTGQPGRADGASRAGIVSEP